MLGMKNLRFLAMLSVIFVLHFDSAFCMKKPSRAVVAAQKKASSAKEYAGEKAEAAKKYLREVVKPAAVKKAKAAKEKIGKAGQVVKEKVEDIPYAKKLTGIDKRREKRKQAIYKIYAKKLVMDAQEDLRKGLAKSKEKNDAKNLKEILDEMIKIDQEVKFAEIVSRKKGAEKTVEEKEENETAAKKYLKKIGVKKNEIDEKYHSLLGELAGRADSEEGLIKREEEKATLGAKIKNFFGFLKTKEEKKQDLELSRLYARKKFEKVRSALRKAGIKEEDIDKEIEDLRKESLFEVASVDYKGEAGAKEYNPKRAREILRELGTSEEEAESISDLSMSGLKLRTEGEELGRMDKFFDIVLGTPGKVLRSEELMKGEVKRGIVSSTKEKAVKTGKVIKAVTEEVVVKPTKGIWERYQK